MTIRFRAASAASMALVLGLSMAAAGCGKYSWGTLSAVKSFKDGNLLYAQKDWKKAAEKYEEVVDPRGRLRRITRSWRPPISSWATATTSSTSRPSRVTPANDAYIQKAIENYRKAADKNTDPAWKKSALQYLSAAYGSDKLNDPAKAEPVYQEIIALEPKEPGNYMALAKLYEDAGRYDDAEAQYNKAKEVKPNDPSVLAGLAGYYNRQGDFPKTIAALEAGRRARAEQSRGLPPRRRLLLGQDPRRLPPLGRREARLHPEGPRHGRQGAQPQPRLHGSADLQEHPPPPQGQHRPRTRPSRSGSSTRPTSSASGSSTRRTASRRARASSPGD